MAPIISENENILKGLIKEIEEKNEAIANLRAEMLNNSEKLEALKKRRLEVATVIEEEKKFERDKKDLVAAVDEEGKIDDFIAFQSDTEKKVKSLLEDEDLKKIEKIIDDKDKEIRELQEKLDELEEEYNEVSRENKEAEKILASKKEDLAEAFNELRKFPLHIKILKQDLQRFQKLIEIASNKEAPFEMAHYVYEIERTIQEIEKLKKSKDQIAARLDKKGLAEAQKKYEDTKNMSVKSSEKVKAQRDLFDKKKKARKEEFLKEIETMFSK